MRRLAIFPALIVAGLVIVAVLILARSDSDVVTSRFQTVQEARSKSAFDRGWIPPVLPDSARDITETNNLDLNTGEGSFAFDASDYQPFVSRLAPASPEVAQRYWSSHTTKGFSIFIHSRDDTFWTLALHPQGTGFYTVESLR